jgi:DNA polymerase-3 subunit beta
LEGTFPDYDSVIPKECSVKIQAYTGELLDAVERVSLFAASSNDSQIILVEINDGTIKIHSQSENGKGDERLTVQSEGGDLNIAFNCRYLIDALKIVDSEKVTFEFVGTLKPATMKLLNDDSFTYLLLPVRA